MALEIQIKTDKRVNELRTQLEKVEDLKFIQEADSINYGEALDYKYKNINVRVYDPDRTEEVLLDPDLKNKTKTYEEVFQKVVKLNNGQNYIYIEIDRENLSRLDQKEIEQKLKTTLHNT